MQGGIHCRNCHTPEEENCHTDQIVAKFVMHVFVSMTLEVQTQADCPSCLAMSTSMQLYLQKNREPEMFFLHHHPETSFQQSGSESSFLQSEPNLHPKQKSVDKNEGKWGSLLNCARPSLGWLSHTLSEAEVSGELGYLTMHKV